MSEEAISMVFYRDYTLVTLADGTEIKLHPQMDNGERLTLQEYQDIFYPIIHDSNRFNKLEEND